MVYDNFVFFPMITVFINESILIYYEGVTRLPVEVREDPNVLGMFEVSIYSYI